MVRMLPTLPERWREEGHGCVPKSPLSFMSLTVGASSLLGVAPVFKGNRDFLHFYLLHDFTPPETSLNCIDISYSCSSSLVCKIFSHLIKLRPQATGL